jgi:peptide/nickel transport system substrate-binding protein
LVVPFKLISVVVACLAFCACSPAITPEPGGKHADGTVTNGVIRYSAADFHESSPGRNGGTLRVSAASDAGSFDIHALSHGNMQWMGRILFDCLVYQDEEGEHQPVAGQVLGHLGGRQNLHFSSARRRDVQRR